MSNFFTRRSNQRALAWLLLLALAPALLYIGHWTLPASLSIPIPGTEFSLGAGTDEPGHHHDGAHCHGTADGCSSASAGGIVAAAQVDNLTRPGMAAGLFGIALALAAWRPRREATLDPEAPPPKPHSPASTAFPA